VLHTRYRRALAGSASALAVIVAITLAVPASAKVRHPEAKEAERISKEPFGPLPKGPMQIFISINQQKLHLYADGQQVAETLVATGVPQLPTPTGVFSVIQKQRFHRSNIYSGAPMPFMQRITWSGVAIHEGENIGHPASHGCIRMPHDFAVKLFGVTKVGVRVIIAREELKPAAFADPHLFVHKAMPQPQPAAATAPVTADPPAALAAADPPAANAAAPPPEPTKVVKISAMDAATPPKPEATATDPVPVAPDAAETETNKTATDNVETKTAQSDDAKAPETSALPKPEVAAADPPAAPEATKAGDGKVAKADPPAPPQAPATAAANAPAPAAQEPAKAVVTTATVPDRLRGTLAGPPPAPAQDPADNAVPVPAAKPAALVEDAAASRGPIAIFVSRKTQKIYVRQNFAPLFDAPVTIAEPTQPFGTLVFTAMNYLDDGATFRWNVVTFPGEPPKVKRVVETRRGRRVVEEAVKSAGTVPAPQTPAEVLARIQIPQDVIDRISALMVPGSSLVVSDQGLGDETGEGTDFIVVTR